jgi:hypothetical protein
MVEQMPGDPATEKAGTAEDGNEPPASGRAR